MLNFLDTSIKNMLANEVPLLKDGEDVHIYFDPPDGEFHPTLPAANLFLYDVRENQGLHRNESLIERKNNGVVIKKPYPIYVDCSYIVTAWAGDTDSEHGVLGQVLAALIRYPVIPKEFLPRDDPPPQPPNPLSKMEGHLVTSALRPGHLQSMAELWQAIGGKPKAALHYTVTVPVILSAGETGVPVKEAQVYVDQIEEKDKKKNDQEENHPEGQINVIEGHKPPVNQ